MERERERERERGYKCRRDRETGVYVIERERIQMWEREGMQVWEREYRYG